MIVSRLYVMDPTTQPVTNLRGFLRGLYNPAHNSAVMPKQYDFVGIGSLSGRSMRMLGLAGGAGGCYVIETSDTWD